MSSCQAADTVRTASSWCTTASTPSTDDMAVTRWELQGVPSAGGGGRTSAKQGRSARASCRDDAAAGRWPLRMMRHRGGGRRWDPPAPPTAGARPSSRTPPGCVAGRSRRRLARRAGGAPGRPVQGMAESPPWGWSGGRSAPRGAVASPPVQMSTAPARSGPTGSPRRRSGRRSAGTVRLPRVAHPVMADAVRPAPPTTTPTRTAPILPPLEEERTG